MPHRAVYEISLARTDEGSGVSSAKGRMVFEITGSACEGYSMRQRMMVNIGDEDGNPSLLDFRIRTFESGDGDFYSFVSRTAYNEDEVEAVAGEARRQGGAIEVKLTEPTGKTIRLDGDALFPSQHMQAILDAAAAEQRFISAEIYEGAGTGEESDAASASIGRGANSGPGGALRSGVRHWPILVGYFDGETDPAQEFGEEMPSYQMSFTLYENGVTNDLVMDYGDYALSGVLDSIEALDPPECP
ncbi:MAG TPA: cell envelope integrity EipB family protein, partial [Propylenella sp.]|nr:cell envelope integrity EipB family protein [Propylenella sp.]